MPMMGCAVLSVSAGVVIRALLKPAGASFLLLMLLVAGGKVAVTESATWSELQLMSGA